MRRLLVRVLLGVATLVVAAAAAASAESPQQGSLTIYSGREERLVKPLLERFTRDTGIQLNVRYASSSALANALVEEGGRSPADVFWATEPGTLGLVAARGLLARLPQATIGKVPSKFATPSRRWVGTSGRARVLVYNTQALTPAQLPTSMWQLTDPKWKDKVALAPTNGSFQAFLAAAITVSGEARVRTWLQGLRANGVKFYSGNTPIVQAVARGDVQLGLVNHYYVYNLLAENPNLAARNHYLQDGDPGSLVFAAGVGIVSASAKKADAQKFVDFLLSKWAQRFIARGPGAAEYPLLKGVLPRPGIRPLREIQPPKYPLGRLSADLPQAVKLLLETGYIK
jgi:iron(III) transport system substrate-binding protein